MAVISHWFLDRLNWGGRTEGYLWHGSPDSDSLQADFWGIFVIAMNVIVMVILLWKCRQYWLGMGLSCVVDLDHVISPLFGHEHWLHNLMWHPWLSTEWSVFLQAGLVALALAMVVPPIQVRALLAAPYRLKEAMARVANGVNGHRLGTANPHTSGSS